MSEMLPIKALIAKKRDGGVHSREELERIVVSAARGDVPEYQVSAWLMAVFFRGLDATETAELTRAMVSTGDRIQRVSGNPLPVDKHSTGGVGDKLSFLVAPLAAAAGAPVPMISGRSLGHTGGTLDKLESIPGFRTDLSPEEFQRCVREVGFCISGQTDRMVPADRLFYALRDAAGIVESVPLITASILSKKIAEGAAALVLDVKHGEGAFMSDLPKARELAATLVETAALLGLPCRAYLTDMDHVLGRTAGNALEIAESVAALRDGPEATSPDLRELALTLTAAMLELSGVAPDEDAARREALRVWRDRSGLERFLQMVSWAGGERSALESPDRLPRSQNLLEVASPAGGRFQGLRARPVGEWITRSGGGRLEASDRIDPRVGVELLVPIGETVRSGQPVARLHLGEHRVDRDALATEAARWIDLREDGRTTWIQERVDPRPTGRAP